MKTIFAILALLVGTNTLAAINSYHTVATCAINGDNELQSLDLMEDMSGHTAIQLGFAQNGNTDQLTLRVLPLQASLDNIKRRQADTFVGASKPMQIGVFDDAALLRIFPNLAGGRLAYDSRVYVLGACSMVE